MNPLSKIAVELQQKGFPQDIVIGDMTFGAAGNQYVEYRGDLRTLPPNWVKVPKLITIQNQLRDCNYTLIHSSESDGNGGIKELWQLSDAGVTWSDENVWVVMARYWEFKKGSR